MKKVLSQKSLYYVLVGANGQIHNKRKVYQMGCINNIKMPLEKEIKLLRREMILN